MKDGTVVTSMKWDLSVCPLRKLPIAEMKAVKVDCSFKGNLPLVQVKRVATELVNLVDNALVDHKVKL